MSPVRNAVLLGAAVVGIDGLTKFFAVKKNLPSLFFNSDTLVFGLVKMSGFFDSLAAAALLLLFTWVYFKYLYSENTLNGYALIFGGAAANLLDGFSDGTVVDFIDIGISTANLADFAIMGGIVLIALQAIRIPPPKADLPRVR